MMKKYKHKEIGKIIEAVRFTGKNHDEIIKELKDRGLIWKSLVDEEREWLGLWEVCQGKNQEDPFEYIHSDWIVIIDGVVNKYHQKPFQACYEPINDASIKYTINGEIVEAMQVTKDPVQLQKVCEWLSKLDDIEVLQGNADEYLLTFIHIAGGLLPYEIMENGWVIIDGDWLPCVISDEEFQMDYSPLLPEPNAEPVVISDDLPSDIQVPINIEDQQPPFDEFKLFYNKQSGAVRMLALYRTELTAKGRSYLFTDLETNDCKFNATHWLPLPDVGEFFTK